MPILHDQKSVAALLLLLVLWVGLCQGQEYMLPAESGIPLNQEHQLNQGLAAVWQVLPRLEGTSTWYDLLGRHPGTLVNGTAWGGTLRAGGTGEVRFDGATTYVDVGQTQDYYSGAQTTLTASVWFQPTTAMLTAANARLYSFQRSAGSLGWALQTSNTTGFLEARYRNAANSAVTLTGTTALDTGWHLGTFVVAGSVATLYLDGKQEGTASDVDAANTFQAGAVPAVLGSFDGSTNTWGGACDEMRLYLRALSSLEVASLWNIGRQGSWSLLNRGWLFSDSAVNTAGFFHFMQ